MLKVASGPRVFLKARLGGCSWSSRHLKTKHLRLVEMIVSCGSELSRREFTKLTLAALAGFSAGGGGGSQVRPGQMPGESSVVRSACLSRYQHVPRQRADRRNQASPARGRAPWPVTIPARCTMTAAAKGAVVKNPARTSVAASERATCRSSRDSGTARCRFRRGDGARRRAFGVPPLVAQSEQG